MADRRELHELLCGFIPERYDAQTGLLVHDVYFQPPQNLAMRYPCIRYEVDRINARHADNLPYTLQTRYRITLIYEDPDSPLPKEIASLPMCIHERHYTADNLYHDIFNLNF